MLERFTTAARAAVTGAVEEARRRGDGWVGTEHLLIALLLHAPDATGSLARAVDVADVRRRVDAHVGGLDADALATIGVDLDEVRRAAEAQFGPGALRRRGAGRRPPLTRRAKKVLELSLREAVRLGQREIRAEHLVLGLLREGDGLACRVLADLGIGLAEVRRDVESRLAADAA